MEQNHNDINKNIVIQTTDELILKIDEQKDVKPQIDEESRLKIEKLKKECSNLDYQLSKKWRRLEWYKAISGIGSILTAFFALFAVVFSIYKWSEDNNISRKTKREELLRNIISSLQDINPRQRIASVVFLKTFLSKKDTLSNSQILISLTNTLAIEENQKVRNTIYDFFRSIDYSILDYRTKQVTLNSLVNSNKEISRNKKVFYKASLSDSIMNDLMDLNSIILNLLNQGIKHQDFKSVFFKGNVFKKIDMSNSNFNDASLIDCNFDSTNLFYTEFDNTLLHNTTFNNATLEQSAFTSSNFKLYSTILDFLENSPTLGDAKIYRSPRFFSSNLTHALFDNFPLLHLTLHLDDSITIADPIFHKCNITGADFLNSCVYSNTPINLHMQKQKLRCMSVQSDYSVFDICPCDSFTKDLITYYKSDYSSVANMFSESNYNNAIFPRQILVILRYGHPE